MSPIFWGFFFQFDQWNSEAIHSRCRHVPSDSNNFVHFLDRDQVFVIVLLDGLDLWNAVGKEELPPICNKLSDIWDEFILVGFTRHDWFRWILKQLQVKKIASSRKWYIDGIREKLQKINRNLVLA
jgi:hypothetical protein